MSRDDHVKPPTMIWGLGFLWAWLTLTLISTLLSIWRIDPAQPNAMLSLVVAGAGGLAGLAFNGFLIYSVNSGKSWARTTFTVLRAIGIPVSLLFAFHRGQPFLLLSIGETAVVLVALALLFARASNVWFDACNV